MTYQKSFTSYSDHWSTPDSFYKKLDAEFQFDYDPCPLNADFDGLNTEWGQINYVNPPYSDWCPWVKKAIEELEKGRISVMLLPARTSHSCFHDYILPYAKEVRFIRGRLKFGNSGKGAPFGSMVVVFDREVS